MFVEEYDQIKKVIEQGDSLEEVIHKAFEEEGESLIPIIEGWLETEFKRVVKKIV
jgi:copper homeostasis protein CutC